MKPASISSILASMIIVILTSSCKKDNDVKNSDPYLSLCAPTSDYYFRGTINDVDKCWNIGENNYQCYSGSGSIGVEGGTNSFWTQGLDQYPEPAISEAIFINCETSYLIENCTREQFINSFIPGTYPLVPVSNDGSTGIEIGYVLNQTAYYTRTGPQDSCQIQLLEAIKTPAIGNTDQIVLKFRFSCNLYSCTGAYFGHISAGELRTVQLRVF